MSPDLRVVTLNLWGRRGDWPQRRALLRAGFAELKPDVVAFQEAIYRADDDQVAEVLDTGWHIAHQTNRGTEGSGVSIASRWPIRDVREIDLRVSDRTADTPLTTLLAEIETPDLGPVVLANHKPSWQLNYELERQRQAVLVARTLESAPSHVVIAGDFDAVPDSASLRFWTGRQSLQETSVCYWDAWSTVHPELVGHTFSPTNALVSDGTEMPLERGRRTDYILVRSGDRGPTLDITDCRLIFDQPHDGVWASDHFGVLADLTDSGVPINDQ
ncbi:endonuclease/exonuclease/phosphatase family protein [Nocardia suismassiliense]|uniref:endonuclease/exonuclease/phosphatase family protein n=1 Tax=Nocardia suismassiliense TaxID=2077092 RepID=UPI000D1DBADA|nr:endonuclease/exonuclease/phosphatase family protein [Nocardia suismassiliense]